AHLRAPTNFAVIEDDGVFHKRAGMHSHSATENGVAYLPTGKDDTSGNDGLDRLTAPALFVEHELRGWIRVSRRAERPFAVVEIERRSGRTEVHRGLIVSIDGANVPPVWNRSGGLPWNLVGREIIDVEFLLLFHEARQDVAAKIVIAVGIRGIFLERF